MKRHTSWPSITCFYSCPHKSLHLRRHFVNAALYKFQVAAVICVAATVRSFLLAGILQRLHVVPMLWDGAPRYGIFLQIYISILICVLQPYFLDPCVPYTFLSLSRLRPTILLKLRNTWSMVIKHGKRFAMRLFITWAWSPRVIHCRLTALTCSTRFLSWNQRACSYTFCMLEPTNALLALYWIEEVQLVTAMTWNIAHWRTFRLLVCQAKYFLSTYGASYWWRDHVLCNASCKNRKLPYFQCQTCHWLLRSLQSCRYHHSCIHGFTDATIHEQVPVPTHESASKLIYPSRTTCLPLEPMTSHDYIFLIAVSLILSCQHQPVRSSRIESAKFAYCCKYDRNLRCYC